MSEKDTPIEVMPAGVYYVGDLCYVLHDEWDEICNWSFPSDGSFAGKGRQGVGQLKDGRSFALFSTAYGDGCYADNQGREYGVDAGLIGCILVSSINLNNPQNGHGLKGGNVIYFSDPFNVGSTDGRISFGDVVINTSYDDEEEIYGEDE